RGAPALGRGVQRAPEDTRGAADARRLRPRDDRTAQGAGHDRLAVPALRVPHDPAREDSDEARRDRGGIGRRGDGRGARRNRARGDGPAALRLASRLAESGHDLRHFTRAMMRGARNLLVTRAAGFDAELVDAAEADAPRVAEIAGRFTEAELVRAFSLLAQLEQ